MRLRRGGSGRGHEAALRGLVERLGRLGAGIESRCLQAPKRSRQEAMAFAVFRWSSSIDLLYKIFQVVSLPPGEWLDLARLAEGCRFRLPEKGCGLHRVLPHASATAVAMVTEILVLNPRRRPLAKRVLEHAYFSHLPAFDLERLDTHRSP